MKNSKTGFYASIRFLSMAGLLVSSCMTYGTPLGPVVDDFSHSANNNLGHARQYLTDAVAGGGTTLEPYVNEDVVVFKGEVVPPRGQPGWASMVLLLDAQNLPKDASAFEGIRLRVKMNHGNMSISANSVEVANFDYHAAPVVVPNDGAFHEVKIPFSSLKRAWSEQTPLNKESISSISIVAFDVKKSTYHFEVDDVAFYK